MSTNRSWTGIGGGLIDTFLQTGDVATSGTFTLPPSCKYLVVHMVGAGSGGGGCVFNTGASATGTRHVGGSGGNSGGHWLGVRIPVDYAVTPSYSWIIGAGGAGGPNATCALNTPSEQLATTGVSGVPTEIVGLIKTPYPGHSSYVYHDGAGAPLPAVYDPLAIGFTDCMSPDVPMFVPEFAGSYWTPNDGGESTNDDGEAGTSSGVFLGGTGHTGTVSALHAAGSGGGASRHGKGGDGSSTTATPAQAGYGGGGGGAGNDSTSFTAGTTSGQGGAGILMVEFWG